MKTNIKTKKLKKFTIQDFYNAKSSKNKISIVTAYDYTSASIINNTEIDCVLVGDSAAVVMSGHQNTLLANIDMMEYHTQSVARGAPDKFIIADMPFLSFRKDLITAVNCAERLIKSGAHAIKIESVYGHEVIIKHLIQSGIPVMGHIGLTPQYIHEFGGYKIQGKSSEQQEDLIKQAELLENLGCFALVLECVPSPLAADISNILNITTIGIGAGVHTDGQVLVWHDLLGLTDYSSFAKKPKFVKEFMNTRDMFNQALNQFHHQVQNSIYPDKDHCYE